MFDTVLVLPAVVILLPVFAVIIIAIRINSKGPAVFKQKRAGKNGTPFTFYKFRTMKADVDPFGASPKSGDDPRLTKIGKFLREYSLDELPQLFNVLKGEMSLVGPRPERPEFVATLSEQIPFFPHRHCVRPGITGWAQINHKYGDTLSDTVTKLEYDLYYIKNLSAMLDFYIMLQTVKVMVLSRGSQ